MEKNKKNIKILPQKWITLFDFLQNSSVAIHLPGYCHALPVWSDFRSTV